MKVMLPDAGFQLTHRRPLFPSSFHLRSSGDLCLSLNDVSGAPFWPTHKAKQFFHFRPSLHQRTVRSTGNNNIILFTCIIWPRSLLEVVRASFGCLSVSAGIAVWTVETAHNAAAHLLDHLLAVPLHCLQEKKDRPESLHGSTCLKNGRDQTYSTTTLRCCVYVCVFCSALLLRNVLTPAGMEMISFFFLRYSIHFSHVVCWGLIRYAKKKKQIQSRMVWAGNPRTSRRLEYQIVRLFQYEVFYAKFKAAKNLLII